MGKRRKRSRIVIAFIILAFAVAGAAAAAIMRKTNEAGVPEITIYLDHENQMYVRTMVAMYKNLSEVAQYSGEDDKYPILNWNLVDKSALSAEEYRSQLLSSLQEGEGPDLVFMDAYSCEDPAKLMEQGYLADLKPWMASGKSVYKDSDFLEGALEAGQVEGKQYLIPVSFDIPVLLTTQERLEQAGISEEDLGDTEGIFAAAAAYQEQTGKCPFDSSGFLENLPQYIGAEEEWSGELRTDVEVIKKIEAKRDGGINAAEGGLKDSAVKAAEDFASGEYLFLTEGIDDYRCMAVQASMLSKEEELVFIPLRRTDGRMQAAVRQAVAVNKNSSDLEAAYAAMNAFFQKRQHNCAGNLPVARSYAWTSLLDNAISQISSRQQEANKLEGSVGWKYAKATAKLVETVSCQTFPLPEDSGTGNGSEKVLSIMVPDDGWNEEGTLYRWIAEAAKEFEDESGIHIEVCEGETAVWHEKLLLTDTAADITVLYHTMVWLGYEDTAEHVLDYREFLEESGLSALPWKEGALERGEQNVLMNIPYLEETTLVSGFIISAKTELPKEALKFIRSCLSSEAYREMAGSIGKKPVL